MTPDDRLWQDHPMVHRMDRAERHNSARKGRFSMETMQTTTPRPDNSRCKAITELIDAVAEQQEALARILEAEHKKSKKPLSCAART